MAQVLDPYDIPHENFQGALILETMMNWDSTNHSQLVPEGLEFVRDILTSKPLSASSQTSRRRYHMSLNCQTACHQRVWNILIWGAAFFKYSWLISFFFSGSSLTGHGMYSVLHVAGMVPGKSGIMQQRSILIPVNILNYERGRFYRAVGPWRAEGTREGEDERGAIPLSWGGCGTSRGKF